MSVSFRKCFGTDTPRTSPLTTPERVKSCSETADHSYVWLEYSTYVWIWKRWATLKLCLPSIAHITFHVKKMFISFRKCLGADTPRTSPLTTPERPRSCSETAKHWYVWLWKEISSTSMIYSSKCLHTSRGIYKKCFYHSGSALVLILHEQVRWPTQMA